MNSFSSERYASLRLPGRFWKGFVLMTSSRSATASLTSANEKNLRSRRAAVIHVVEKPTERSTSPLSCGFLHEQERLQFRNTLQAHGSFR